MSSHHIVQFPRRKLLLPNFLLSQDLAGPIYLFANSQAIKEGSDLHVGSNREICDDDLVPIRIIRKRSRGDDPCCQTPNKFANLPVEQESRVLSSGEAWGEGGCIVMRNPSEQFQLGYKEVSQRMDCSRLCG